MRWYQTSPKRLVIGGLALAGALVLAVSAIPTGDEQGKAKGYMSVMKSELLTLRAVEDSAFRDTARYTITPRWAPATAGVSWPRIVAARGGWNATVTWIGPVTYRGFRGVTCGIAVGMANPIVPEAPAGEPACRYGDVSPAGARERRD